VSNIRVEKEMIRASEALRTGVTIAKQLDDISKGLRPFQPEVKSFRIDYIEKASEVRYLLLIPSGVRRRIKRRVEIPAVLGFRVHEMWDLDTLEMVDCSWSFESDKWVFDPKKLPNSEKYALTLKGKISTDFLSQLVNVKAAENPCREKDVDKYWIHSALKDVSILERIWDELNIERVNMEVKVGVERFFTSAIPSAVKERLKTTSQLLEAIARGDRNREQRLKVKYKTLQRIAKISPAALYDLILKLVSGDFFVDFVGVDEPFIIGNIEPSKQLDVMIPKRVKVGVQTNLNFKMPAANGNLKFERKNYVDSITEKINDFLPERRRKKRS
jgi:hypothetical protein